MKKKIPTLIIGLCSMVCIQAQTLSPSVIPAEGGTATACQISLDWTLGEISVESIRTDPNIYTEGFHQPRLKVEIAKTPD